jgi:hypothetical protein
MFGALRSATKGTSTLSRADPIPLAGPSAQRLRSTTWLNGRVALGTLLVVVAVLAGALFLDRAQQEVVPALVEVEVAVPHLSPAVW